MPTVKATDKVSASTVFSSTQNKAVMVGKNASTGAFETWTWDGANWSQVTAAQPPNRIHHAISDDGSNVMLFGGTGGYTHLNDTWTFNGTTWTQQNLSTYPDGRSLFDTAYLAGTGVIMFGGKNASKVFNDTWLWNGTAWSKLNPVSVPPPRFGHNLAASGSTIAMFGGANNSGYLNDTWTFNGTVWTNVSTTPTSPSGRIDFGFVYDTAHSQWVLFGGRNYQGVNNETWTFNGTSWTKQAVPPAGSPPGRSNPQMAFDTVRNQVVLFGGKDNNKTLGDTWVWNGSTWTQI